MTYRQTIQFAIAPAAFRLRQAQHRGDDLPDIGPTEEELRAEREAQTLQQSQQIQETLGSLQFAIDEYEQRRQQSLSELQHVAIELAMMAASHVVHSELQRDSFGVESLVAETIVQMAILEPATVRIHPGDLDLLQSRVSGKTTPWNDDLITLVADTAIDRGAVRLETESGRVVLSDAVTRLNQVRDHWTENIHDTQIEHRSVSKDAQSVRRFPDRRETA